MKIREDVLKRLSEEYCASVVQHRDQILGAAALVLLRVEAMSEGWRNFLIIAFPPRTGEVFPKILVYYDNRCAYCGKRLTTSRFYPVEKIRCVVCGKEVSEDKNTIICVDGHHVCEECYKKDIAKLLVQLILELFIKNHETIMDHVRKKLENIECKELPLEYREMVAFSDTIYSIYNEISKSIDRKMEVTLFVGAFILDWFEYLASCSSRCKEFCPSALKVLRRLGVVEGEQ